MAVAVVPAPDHQMSEQRAQPSDPLAKTKIARKHVDDGKCMVNDMQSYSDGHPQTHSPRSSTEASCDDTGSESRGITARNNTDDSNTHRLSETRRHVVQTITTNQIGRNALFRTPFGAKAQCYTDFTASGKPLQCIEDFVQREVLPLYGNTHTSTSVTGLQMTSFREDARETIARAVNAKISGPRPTDCVLFTGQGTTSAVNKLVSMLDLARLGAHKNPERRPVVFVGPFEHHSNLLPWRESGAKVVIIPEGDDGKVCVATLAKELKQHAHRPLRIGAFSAASNLTGVLSDVDALCMVLHQHGALAFFDYATCGPYVKIDMNPAFPTAGGAGVMLSQYVYRDGIFLSGHKFVGGPGATGLLVVKSNLTELRGGTPTAPGGGTVLFVTHTDHRYLSHATDREEGGTPDILGNIRLGLAFQVKQRVGEQAILELEHANMRRAFASLSANENIVLLGRSDVDKLPIFSFLVRFHDRFLHYNFVCALLNDLFGVQSRGGCQCAGPYAARLLGIELDDLGRFTDALVDGQGALKPGFTRMSFPYFMDARELDYILDAVHFVATDGWKFLPQYRCDLATGSWTHVGFASSETPRFGSVSGCWSSSPSPPGSSVSSTSSSRWTNDRLDLELQQQRNEAQESAMASLLSLPTIKSLQLFDDAIADEIASVISSGEEHVLEPLDEDAVAAHRASNLSLARRLAQQSVDHVASLAGGVGVALQLQQVHQQPQDLHLNPQSLQYGAGVDVGRFEEQQRTRLHWRYHRLRWFVESWEVADLLGDGVERPKLSLEVHGPCQPQRYFQHDAVISDDSSLPDEPEQRGRKKSLLSVFVGRGDRSTEEGGASKRPSARQWLRNHLAK